ncbi:SDR family oxidoreductase [Moorena sp. SIO3B2]|uniref:SDR family oxidoreductase n=1 Tax=Moorena sp. SIO3B2 TaxID=2607827 RepID=UPI0013CD465A|nr:SDR family oxidoreductase [Moorena sp. SIO3B2]NEP36207.1 SDR family oxidoreductase [Moorena sp. SIO3B2]
MTRLANKTAVITGGSTGIGFETAKQFIAQGARVIITGQNETRLNAAADALGENAIPVKADVRSRSVAFWPSLTDLDHLTAQVEATFGTLDILFANAGIGYFAPIEQVDEAFYDNQFDINVKGVFFTVQKLVGLLNEGASIILNASAVNEKGVPMGSLYFATKAAVRSFARSLAAELAPRQIRVNAVSPGIVRTNFESKLGLPDGAFEGFMEAVKEAAPLHGLWATLREREGKPEEIAQAVVFLASNESSYVTAVDLVVDGGYMNV